MRSGKVLHGKSGLGLAGMVWHGGPGLGVDRRGAFWCGRHGWDGPDMARHGGAQLGAAWQAG